MGKRSETGTLLTSLILHVAPDGTVKSKWEFDRIDVTVLAPDGLFYGSRYDFPSIEVHDKLGKLVRKISTQNLCRAPRAKRRESRRCRSKRGYLSAA